MYLSDVVNILITYSGVAFFTLIIPCTLFLLSYFIVYRKLLNGRKRPAWEHLIPGLMLVYYIIIVLGATVFFRTLSRYGLESVELRPFSLYLSAIRTDNAIEWRNLILNIIMFMPIGVLLPLTFTFARSFWKTFAIACALSILIETTQLVLGTGIFATDDILNNTLGGIAGFVLFRIGLRALCSCTQKSEQNVLKAADEK